MKSAVACRCRGVKKSLRAVEHRTQQGSSRAAPAARPAAADRTRLERTLQGPAPACLRVACIQVAAHHLGALLGKQDGRLVQREGTASNRGGAWDGAAHSAFSSSCAGTTSLALCTVVPKGYLTTHRLADARPRTRHNRHLVQQQSGPRRRTGKDGRKLTEAAGRIASSTAITPDEAPARIRPTNTFTGCSHTGPARS